MGSVMDVCRREVAPQGENSDGTWLWEFLSSLRILRRTL
jgi:hypothetical protein